MDPAEYYRDREVRRCVREYSGLTTGAEHGAVFMVGLGVDQPQEPRWEKATPVVPDALSTLWDAGVDVARSLWDLDHLVFLLDLDYLNVDAPGEPFLHPAEVFFKLDPTYRAARRVLARLSLDADVVMSGRGYHFVGLIPLEDPVVPRLAALVPDAPPWWYGVEARRPDGVNAPMSPRQARAAEGLGLLLEYLGHLVKTEVEGRSAIPVVFNGTAVGTGLVGRECVSIDFSHVGDPLDTRHMRTAFSTYQWHRVRPDIFGPVANAAVPPLVLLPQRERSFTDLLERGRGLDAGIAAAALATARLPTIARGVAHLLDQYLPSPLAGFHRTFLDATARNASSEIRSIESLPPCVSLALERPNDLLLKPEHLQQVVRSLMAREWLPADIAALVRTRYEEDHGWGDRWHRLNPQSRAAFDVRVFAGMIHTGLDTLVDCNCVSAQEKGLCPQVGCPYNLQEDRARLEVLRSR